MMNVTSKQEELSEELRISIEHNSAVLEKAGVPLGERINLANVARHHDLASRLRGGELARTREQQAADAKAAVTAKVSFMTTLTEPKQLTEEELLRALTSEAQRRTDVPKPPVRRAVDDEEALSAGRRKRTVSHLGGTTVVRVKARDKR